MTQRAIIVLGGGIKDARQLSQSTQLRLDAALEQHSPNDLVIIAGAGPAESPPPLDSRGFPVFESVGAVKYLLQRGLNPELLLYETSSYDTIGNAYFSRTIHVEPLQLVNITVITSQFHLARTQMIFKWIYGLTAPVEYQLQFVGVEDHHLGAELLTQHRLKEQQRMVAFTNIMEHTTTLKQFHDWMFNHHQAYIAHLEPIEIATTTEEKQVLEKG